MQPKKHQWPSFRGDQLNSAAVTVEMKEAQPFEYKTTGLIWSTPIIDDKENVYVGSADKHFYSLDSSGQLRWKYKIKDVLDSLIDSAAVLVGDMVIVAGGDGFLHALDEDTGEKIWEFEAYHADAEKLKTGELVNSFEGNIVKGPEHVYAGSDNGHMYCVGLDGKEVWNFKTGMMIWSAPCFYKNWMAFGSLDGHLYLLDSETGKELDSVQLGEIKASPAYDPKRNLIFVGTSKGIMYAYHVIDSKLKKAWEYKAGEEIYSSAAYFDETVFFASGEKFYALNFDGEKMWEYNAYAKISSSPAVIKDTAVLFGAGNGKMYALNFDGERVWSYKTTTSLHKANLDSSPAISKSGSIYVGSYNGSIYKIPYQYCLNTKSDRIENGGKRDVPFKKGSAFRFENRSGAFVEKMNADLSEPIKLRLTAFEKDQYIQNAALSSVSISISPEVPFKHTVSGDGFFLTIIPETFWREDTEYTISISASYYTRTTLVADMFKRVGLPKVEEKMSFSTSSLKELDKKEASYGLHSFSIFQPLSLNTLIAAAMDGQQYISEFSAEGEELSVKLFPAYETETGFAKIENEDRTVKLQGKLKGSDFIVEGSPTLTSMGATIPLSYGRISGRIIDGKITNGTFLAETSCLGLKGNSTSYTIPMNVISDLCGRDFRLVVVARYDGESL